MKSDNGTPRAMDEDEIKKMKEELEGEKEE